MGFSVLDSKGERVLNSSEDGVLLVVCDTHYCSVAEDRFLESLQLVENLPPEDSYTYFLAVLKNLGLFYMQFKKFDLSASLYHKAHEVSTKVNKHCILCIYLYRVSESIVNISSLPVNNTFPKAVPKYPSH